MCMSCLLHCARLYVSVRTKLNHMLLQSAIGKCAPLCQCFSHNPNGKTSMLHKDCLLSPDYKSIQLPVAQSFILDQFEALQIISDIMQANTLCESKREKKQWIAAMKKIWWANNTVFQAPIQKGTTPGLFLKLAAKIKTFWCIFHLCVCQRQRKTRQEGRHSRQSVNKKTLDLFFIYRAIFHIILL